MKIILTILFLITFNQICSAQAWNRKAYYPGSGGRAVSSAFSIPSIGRGYVIGGGNTGYDYDAWSYDTLSDSWTQLPDFPGQSSGHVAFSINGKGYVGTGVAGGYSWSNLFFEYDPTSNTWIPRANFPGAPRAYGAAFSIGDTGYMGGGTHATNFNGFEDFYKYDPSADKWTRIANCPAKGVANFPVAFSIGNKGYVGTGAALDSIGYRQIPQKDFWEYDPSTNIWTQKADFGGGTRQSAMGFATCDKGYIGCGNSDAQQTILNNDFWQYDPVSDSWKQIASVGDTARQLGVGFAIGQAGYIGTGRLTVNGGYISDWWEYHATYTPAFTTGASSSQSICVGQSVSFADTSDYSPTNWQWSFPGGTPNSSGASTVTVAYDTAGTYNVTLSAWNGCDSATKIFTNYITVNSSTSLAVSPSTPKACSGQNINLWVNIGGSAYKWSPGTFLNKTTGDSVIVTGSSLVDSIVYTVMDTSGSGCPATGHVTVKMGGSDTAGIVSAIRDTICLNTEGNLSLSGNSSNIIQWQSSTDDINFTNVGDTLANYKTAPLQQTTWYKTIVGTGNCTATSNTLQLYVPPALTASFYFTQSSSNQLTFNSDSSVGSIRSYHWDFGDGGTSIESNPSHTYAKDSTYYVCLTLYDGSNCSYTFCRYSSVTDAVPTISAAGNWIIYPNPFNEQLTVSSKQTNSQIQSIEMFDVLGQLVINKSLGNTTNTSLRLDVSSLAKGMYYVTIRTADADYMQKVVKQ